MTDRPILLCCIHVRILQETDHDNRISRKRLLEILGKLYHIPKEQRDMAIKDLKRFGIIVAADKKGMIMDPRLPKEYMFSEKRPGKGESVEAYRVSNAIEA